MSTAEKNIAENTYIEAPKDPVKDIRQTPLDLLKEFEWCDTDIDDPVVAKVRSRSFSGAACACGLTLAAGDLRPSQPKLRGGRRQHVPLRLFDRFPSVVRLLHIPHIPLDGTSLTTMLGRLSRRASVRTGVRSSRER